MTLDLRDEPATVTPGQSLSPGVDDRLGKPRARRPRPALGRLIGPLLLVGVWFAATGLGWVDERTLPSPGATWDAASRLLSTGALQEHLAISLQRAMIGLFFGIVAGTVLAVVAGLSTWGERLVDANMQMLRAMPILALVPLAIVWFGIGEEVKVILVALGVTFPMYVNTHAAIRAVDSRYVDLAHTLGLSKLALIGRVILPGALPGWFTGLRFAASIAWLVLVVSEQINASSGIGFLMTQARGISATDVIVVGLVIYALLGLVSDTLVRFFERKALTWRSTLQST
ncbi:MAG: ABC transporter permease [Nocardioides sp.]|uniref:ABC transporter permease n=1 Tax=Nocardioides sp. TaxID=35761 RepID=UPI003EFC8093